MDELKYEPIDTGVKDEDLFDKQPEAQSVPMEIPKLMMSDSFLTNEQAFRLLARTPKTAVHTREAKGGGTWSYVTGTYVRKVLNYVFGWDWSFEIMNHGKEGDTVWVLGKLTVNHPTILGKQIIKMQYGRKDVMYRVLKTKGADGKIAKQKTDILLDFGNDLKAAATDALKKCAAELGIASDVYAAEEYQAIKLKSAEPKEEPKETEVGKKQRDELLAILAKEQRDSEKEVQTLARLTKNEFIAIPDTEQGIRNALLSIKLCQQKSLESPSTVETSQSSSSQTPTPTESTANESQALPLSSES